MSVEANASAAQATTTPAAAANANPTPTEAPKPQDNASATPPAAQSAPTETKPAAASEAQKVEAAKETAEAKSAETKETKPASEQKPVAPEKYDLKLPKDSVLSEARIEKLSAYAKENGLSNDQAQSLLDRENEAVSDYVTNLKESQSKLMDSWVETAKADKEIGGEAFKQNVEQASRVVTRFGTEEFKKELNKSGLGNHPELIRTFSRIAKQMSEDQLVIPGVQAGGKKSIESILYGDSSNKES